MAIYFASPFGTIVGKVNGQVACRWRGRNVIKKLTIPTDRGNLLKYQQMKEGLIPPEAFSFPQFNLRRVIMNPLMFMGRHNPTFLHAVWKNEVDARKLDMGALNLFCKSNVTTLYASMDKALEFDPITNSPDLAQLKMAEGILEDTKTFTATYDTATGEMVFTWNADHFTNGLDTDYAMFAVVKKPILEEYGIDKNWEPALAMYYLGFPTPPALPSSRVDGTDTRDIDPGLAAADLTAFIFFFTAITAPRYISKSLSVQVIAPV